MSGLRVEERRHLSVDKHEATRQWLEQQESETAREAEVDDEVLTYADSIAESSVVESSDGDFDTDTDTEADAITTQVLGTQIDSSEMSSITQSLKELFNSVNSIQTVGNVKIENSTGVHIGNITNINGNIQIIHAGSQGAEFKFHSDNKRKNKKSARPPRATVIAEEEHEERVNPDAFLERIKFRIPKRLCAIIPRHTWLAQLPMEEYKYMPEPVKYIIISHTATESSEKQAINIRIIRDIQCFHIESREWNDIAYNFLVGCDGNVYEGRGWGVVGAHTRGYNTMALGISFIGCFMRELPTQAAINACTNFLKKGVKEGHLAADYKLICHCQCSPTESPGRKLFEEIQTWENFYDLEEALEENTEKRK